MKVGVVDVGETRREPHHPRALRADEDGGASRPGAARRNLAITGLVIPSLEIDPAFSKQRSNDLQRLFEAANPVIVGIPERMVLGLVPAGTDTEHQTPVTHLIQGDRHLGEQRAFQVTIDADYVDRDSFARPGPPMIVPARTFLSQML